MRDSKRFSVLAQTLMTAIGIAEDRGEDLRHWWQRPDTQDALKMLDDEERRAVIARKDHAKERIYG